MTSSKNAPKGEGKGEIFLARGGRVHGPFSQTEFEAMSRDGGLQSYSWMWDGNKELWKPLDPPPPPLNLDGRKTPAPKEGATPIGYEALCHNHRAVVSGILEAVTETGCEFLSPDGETPAFALESTIVLNLLHPDTGHSINVPAKLVGAKRTAGRWEYRLRWQECPRFAS